MICRHRFTDSLKTAGQPEYYVFSEEASMKQYFIASICREGIIGGGIIADDDGITFKTGKITVSSKIKNLEMKYRNIREFSRKWVFCFPVFSIVMDDGEIYKFIIFRPNRFSSLLSDKVPQ